MMNRDSIRISLLAIALSVAGFVVAYQFVEPSPPKHLTLAAGSKSGAYYAFAGRYAAVLARDGISVDVVETGGSVDNIALLADGKADIAFIQGGVGDVRTQPSFYALGSLYFEPLWVFVRQDAPIKVLSDLTKQRIAAGGEGSGTWAVTRQLLELNGVPTDGDEVRHLDNADAVRALQAGEVDAAFFVASPTAPLVLDLLGAKGLRLLNFERAYAYTSQLRHLSAVTLHRGVISLSRDIPPSNLTLLAPTANLVTTDTLHPALAQLLVGAMIEVHSAGGLFESPGQFPSVLYTDYPMNADAQRYLKEGQPFLQRFLPFWAAVLIDRLIILAVPLVTLMFPLMKVLPPVYRWRVRSRIFRWYGELSDIERRAQAGESKIVLAQALSAMADEVRTMKVPLSYADEVFDLRLHIELIRRELHV